MKLRVEDEIDDGVPADGTFSEHQAGSGGIGIWRLWGEHRYQTAYLEHFRNIEHLNVNLTLKLSQLFLVYFKIIIL